MSQKSFHFIGKAPLSKSLLNRALIIKSWYPDFVIHGSSSCEDILTMESAVRKISQLGLAFRNSHFSKNDVCIGKDKNRDSFISIDQKDSDGDNKKLNFETQNKEFNCGLSGTAFRFLALRLSREKGEFILKGDKALFKRPLEEASSLLSQLSVSIKKTNQAYVVSSKSWSLQGDCVYVPSKITSQWASALLLNSWNLDQDFYFVFNSYAVSYPYFKMTLDFVRYLGLKVQQEGSEFFIPKGQNLKIREYYPEQDKSCLFALACFAVLNGKAIFLDWEEKSLQADHIFTEVLKSMGVSVELRKNQPLKPFDFSNKAISEKNYTKNNLSLGNSSRNISSSLSSHFEKKEKLKIKPVESKENQLIVSKCENLKKLDMSLKGQPDLFLMLAVLCAKTEALSVLRDISHLDFKESSRALKLKELLEKCGIKAEIQKDNFLIYGQKNWSHKILPFDFDTEQDHRLVMSAELIASLGVPINLKGKSAVNKSFPEFYSLIQS